MNDLKLSARLLFRDLRSGELALLFVALLVAVSAMTTVGFFSERVEKALESQAGRLIGADLVVDSDHPLSPAFASQARKTGLVHSRSVKFPSMVNFRNSSLLVEIKAVENGYPLRGKLRISNGLKGIPAPGTIWVDRKLLVRLHVAAGSVAEIGDARFRVAGIVEEEPEAAFSFMSLGPGLIMNLSDLPSTGLIREGSRVHYVFYLAGNSSGIAAYRNWAKSTLGRGQRIEDAREGSPQLRDMLDHSGVFLKMAALLSVVLAAVAVSLSVRRFVERHLDGCAVMRVLGATRPRLLRLFLYQFSMLGLAAGLLGGLAGFFAQRLLAGLLSGFFSVALPDPSLLPAFEGFMAGMLLLLGFSLPPVFSLAKVPALHVIRREIAAPKGGYALGLAALLLLFLWQAGSMKLGLIVFGGFCFMLLFSALVVRFFLGNLGAGGSGWRYGLASLKRRRTESAIQIVAFGLGLMAVLTLTLVRGDLFETWEESLPVDAPNRFVLNIQHEEMRAVADFFRERKMPVPQFFPMVRARLVGMNGRSVSSKDYQESRAKRLVDREFNLSWRQRQGNEIVAGKWWGKGSAGKPFFSVEEGLAKTLSITMGDELTFEIAGNRLTGKVTNLRRVDWNSFKVNFFVLTPPGVLDAYPTSYITSFYVPPGNDEAMSALSKAFPTLLVVDVSTIIARMRAMMDQAAKAVEFVFYFSLAAGVMVLVAAFSSTQDERMREGAILRTLGASRRQIVTAHFSEFLMLGGFSGLFGAIGATGIGYLVSKKLLDQAFGFDPVVALAGLAAGMLVIPLLGLFWTTKVLANPPSAVLRDTG